VALQHNLKHVTLDNHIDLGNYTFDPYYAQAQVKVTGKQPGTWTTQTGQSSTYWVTLVKNASNRKAADLFLEYLLNPAGGLKALEEKGEPVISQARSVQKTSVRRCRASFPWL
jgi:molybdate/tungstate transport system substrate-binding protein